MYVCISVCARVFGGGHRIDFIAHTFKIIINTFYLHFISNVLVNCCKDQANKYVVYGYLNSKMSPDAYLEKLTDYKDEEMKINYIGVRVL